MSAITAKASRKMKKYAVLTREPRCFLGSFDFSWEQRKFEEIAVRSSVICSDDTLPRVEYEDIVSGTGRLNKDIYAKQSSKSGIVFHQGDVLYGKLRPYLQNWLLPTFDGLAVGDFWVLQPQNADSSFLYRLIQSRQFDEVANQSTGTKMPRADWKLVSKTVFSIPSNISEQAAIGTYFTALDSLITLHQRKYEKLTNVKKSMLEKMFPQNGSSYPEIRFKGFTDPWEQRKVGDFYDFKNGLNKGKAFFGKGTPIVNFTDVFHKRGITTQMLRGRVTLTPSEISNYGVKQGDIFVTRTSETIEEIGYASVMLDSPKDTVFSGFVLRGRAIKEDPLTLKFKQFVFSTDAFRSEMIKKSSMTTRALTSGTAIKKMYFQYPVSTEEQNRIGQFLESLDHLITLHQRELEKLQNIKKSMLEKMFV